MRRRSALCMNRLRRNFCPCSKGGLSKSVPRRASLFANALSRLTEYTKAETTLNIEGFLRFRLADAANLIRLCALRAAMEELIRRELSAGTDGETIIIITRDTDPSTEPD